MVFLKILFDVLLYCLMMLPLWLGLHFGGQIVAQHTYDSLEKTKGRRRVWTSDGVCRVMVIPPLAAMAFVTLLNFGRWLLRGDGLGWEDSLDTFAAALIIGIVFAWGAAEVTRKYEVEWDQQKVIVREGPGSKSEVEWDKVTEASLEPGCFGLKQGMKSLGVDVTSPHLRRLRRYALRRLRPRRHQLVVWRT